MHTLPSNFGPADKDRGWSLPPRRWVKLNTDGAVDQITRKAAVEGFIPNNKSNWETGFNRNIGIRSVLEAGLWAALDDLTIDWVRGRGKMFAYVCIYISCIFLDTLSKWIQ